MKKILILVGVLGAALLLIFTFIGAMYLPVKITAPSGEVENFPPEYFLNSLRNELNNHYDKGYGTEDSQYPQKKPVLSDDYKDYATIFLRAKVKNRSFLKADIQMVTLDEQKVNFDDGIFIAKPSAEHLQVIESLETVEEKGLISAEICIKGMTKEEILAYVKTLSIEVTIETLAHTYTVPVSFESAEVVFVG